MIGTGTDTGNGIDIAGGTATASAGIVLGLEPVSPFGFEVLSVAWATLQGRDAQVAAAARAARAAARTRARTAAKVAAAEHGVAVSTGAGTNAGFGADADADADADAEEEAGGVLLSGAGALVFGSAPHGGAGARAVAIGHKERGGAAGGLPCPATGST